MKITSLQLTALVGFFAFQPLVLPAATGVGASFKGPIGLQLYSLRAQFTKNVPETMAVVRGFGITEVELAGTYNLSTEKFTELLKTNRLQAISGHFPFERFRDDLDGVVKEAKALGLQYAGAAWIPHGNDFTEIDLKGALTVFNKAGEALAKQGMKFFYHCHGYEFAAYQNGTYMDALLAGTDSKTVSFEMDIFWVMHAGQEPGPWLMRYPGRWELLHLKDMKNGVRRGEFTGKSDVENDVAFGTGQMNWAAILGTAKIVGVKHYFIEDESSRSVEQIPQSLKFLETLTY